MRGQANRVHTQDACMHEGNVSEKKKRNAKRDNRISRLTCFPGFVEEIDLIKSNLSFKRRYESKSPGLAHDDRTRDVARVFSPWLTNWRNKGEGAAASVFAAKITSI